MKTSTLFAALALSLAASGAALAQEIIDERPQALNSQKTRAEVVAELKQARAAGLLQVGEIDHAAVVPFSSTLTRADVRAQTLAAIASGELRELNRNHDNPFQPRNFATPAATQLAGK